MLKICNPRYRLRILFAAAATSAAGFVAAEVPDLTALPRYQTAIPYAGIRNWHVTQNLGPTGARGWIYGHKGNSLKSREILIKSVEAGSPADGVLRPYDVISGAAVPDAAAPSAALVNPFDSDARLALARAITYAESEEGSGKLRLLRWRDGAEEEVTIRLPVLGTYSETAPFECAKTDRIVSHAAAFLDENMGAKGFGGMTGALNALFLYATGDDRYLDHVRRSACNMSVNHTITDAGHETWRWGYYNLFLTEYYLATGDRRVLPTIQEYCDVLAAGQCSPGTWGHKAVPDFIPPGYGSMNQSGLVCYLSMLLGQAGGLDVDETALRRSTNFYGGYAGRGGIPYGDHSPAITPTGNGKNGSAALALSQIDADRAAQWFARLCASTDLGAFEGGHTGNFFNQTWTPLGAALAGPENYQNFWSRFNSYRDLARRSDGSFVTQPLPHTREGDLATGNYVKRGPMWSTGGFTLSYLAGTRRLAILGRSDSVFGGNPPETLKPALDLYEHKKFEKCRKAAGEFVDAEDARLRRLARQLQNAARRNSRSLELTLADMQKKLTSGDLYPLQWQLQAIESIVDKGDERLQPFREAVEDPANSAILAAGAVYHKNTAGLHWSGMHGFQVFAKRAQGNQRSRNQLKQLADNGAGVYRKWAREHLQSHPMLVSDYTPLFEAEDSETTDATAWRLLPRQATDDEAWTLPGFDDSNWQAVGLPSEAAGSKGVTRLRRSFAVEDATALQSLVLEYVLEGHMTVYLNGRLIMDVSGGGWPRVKTILLKPVTGELLREKNNCLAVLLKPRPDDKKFRLSLKGAK